MPLAIFCVEPLRPDRNRDDWARQCRQFARRDFHFRRLKRHAEHFRQIARRRTLPRRATCGPPRAIHRGPGTSACACKRSGSLARVRKADAARAPVEPRHDAAAEKPLHVDDKIKPAAAKFIGDGEAPRRAAASAFQRPRLIGRVSVRSGCPTSKRFQHAAHDPGDTRIGSELASA